MTDEEIRKFLIKMGYNPRMLNPEPHITNKAKKETVLGPDGIPKNHVDKQELLNIYRIFHKDKETEHD
jgi:hypothetical protein